MATHDFKLPYPFGMIGLALLLAALVAINRGRADRDQLPFTNGWFWAGMFAAGTLGIVTGDHLALEPGLDIAAASGAMTVVLVAALGLRAWHASTSITFWMAVVVIRTWGTNAGALLTDSVGLEASTSITGAALTGLLLAS